MECCPMINPSYENSCHILVESLNLVIFTLDELGKITYVSSGCTERLGFLPEEMMDIPMSAFVIAEDRGRVGEMCGQAKQRKTSPSVFRVVGKDGGLHQTSVISRSVLDGQEKSGMIGVIGEVSPGKQAEKIIRQANTRIHHLNSTIRHDINNQLTVVNGYLSLMEQNESTIKPPEIVKILLNATDQIYNLVSFTREYQDIGTHLPMWTNLYESFHSAGSTFDAAGVQITTEPGSPVLELFTDPLLTKVFHHLINYSLSHGKTVSEISLLWRLENGGAIIVYEDNGCGIPETVRPTIFQYGKGKKNGEGLFLVHEILAIYGFNITERGTMGKGVRFEIVVPAGSFRVVENKH